MQRRKTRRDVKASGGGVDGTVLCLCHAHALRNRSVIVQFVF